MKLAAGNYSVAVGQMALASTVGGTSNVAVGRTAGFNILGDNWSGSYNLLLGDTAGYTLTTGSDNVIIGASADVHAATDSNEIVIGKGAVGNGSNTTTIGNATTTSAFVAGIRGKTTGVADAVAVYVDSNGQLGTTSSSRRYKEDIATMGDVEATLLRLRPVTFRYIQPFANGSKPIQYGLIAEEVADVMPDLAVFNADGSAETVKYHLLPALLLNVYQQQHRTIDAQAARITAQDQRIATLDGQNSAQRAESASLKAAAQGQQTENDALKARVETQQARVQAQQTRIEGQQARIETLEAQMAAVLARFEALLAGGGK